MATTDSKMRSFTGALVANMLTTREDDFTFKVTYLGNRTIDSLCQIAVKKGKSKFTESELRSAYNDLFTIAKEELYSASTVEFGFANNSLEVDGPFHRPQSKIRSDKKQRNITMTVKKIIKTQTSELINELLIS